ncbi:glycoside hydrolase family protein [Azospirillum sp. Sh1]|nr:glycoside hydrolase family protein [Azospirillum sp. Sh1]
MVTNTTKPICQAAVDLVKHFEGLYPTAYLCPAGVPTIGYGHTAGVKMGQSITAEQADAFLAADLTEAAGRVDALVKVALNDDQRGALSSFVFNLGAGSLGSSTLLKMLNAGDYAGAADQFGRWVYATVNGKPTKLAGLVARRAAEAALFSGGAAVLPAEQPHPMPQMVAAPAGDEDDEVRAVQRIVGAKVDGIFGPATALAVKKWQFMHNLEPTGVVDQPTRAKMGI